MRFTAIAATMLSGTPGVVAFAVSGRAVDDRRAISDAGLLRRLRNAVDVGAQRDHGLARSESRHPRRRNAGDAALNREAFLFQDAGQIALRLEFLKAQLAEAEDGVDHLLREVVHAVDARRGFGLVGGELRRRACCVAGVATIEIRRTMTARATRRNAWRREYSVPNPNFSWKLVWEVGVVGSRELVVGRPTRGSRAHPQTSRPAHSSTSTRAGASS